MQELSANAEPASNAGNDTSSSSRDSTPEVQRRKSTTPHRNSVNSTDNYHNKPAITAPRSAPPPVPARTSSAEGITVALRNKQNNGKLSFFEE